MYQEINLVKFQEAHPFRSIWKCTNWALFVVVVFQVGWEEGEGDDGVQSRLCLPSIESFNLPLPSSLLEDTINTKKVHTKKDKDGRDVAVIFSPEKQSASCFSRGKIILFQNN